MPVKTFHTRSANVIEEIATKSYRSPGALSKQLYERASRVMPGGNTRHSIALAPYPIYARSGIGCRVTDVEGDERIDFLNNYTSLILGHADPQVTSAVTRRVSLGTAFTMPAPEEVELAELLAGRIPYVEQIRFCNSGSEAVMLAVKAARAFTGRHKIAKFEGAYHGIYDYAEVSESPKADEWGESDAPGSVVEPGTPPGVASDVVVLPWNRFEACRERIRSHKDDLAALVVDPMPLGIGMIAPRSGFLELLREETARYGILLIADEVLTFRLSYHGSAHAFGIQPDLGSFGKIIGGGFPVGAVGGSRQVMSVFDHTGSLKVRHGGTFNANPVTMTAGIETMKQMTPEAYSRLNALGDYLRERLARIFRDRGMPAQVCGRGSLFLAHLSGEELIDFRSLCGFSRNSPVYGELCHQMLQRGIILSPRGVFGCLSTPMSEGEADAFVNALESSLTKLTM
ncbi:MAG: aspartate aminotransferase family protein [Acidobacteria bacterium]|nr:MAG: aspartate aminotransferase family protein [Acidobacteriota bacterium]